MNTYYFYNLFFLDGVRNGEDINRIALTPEVAYEFDKRGITYSKLEDFYSERELIKNRGLFLEIDEYICRSLFEIFAENDLALEPNDYQIYFYYIKTYVESLFVRLYIYRELFNKLSVSTITYYFKEGGGDDTDFRLLEYFSKERGFRLKMEVVQEHFKKEPYVSTNGKMKLFDKLKNIIISHFREYLTWPTYLKGQKEDVLFLSTDYNLWEIVDTKRGEGKRIWFYNRTLSTIEFKNIFLKRRRIRIGAIEGLKINLKKIEEVSCHIKDRLFLIDGTFIERRLKRVIACKIQPSLERYLFFRTNSDILDRFKEVISAGYSTDNFDSFYLYFYKFKRNDKRTILKHGDDPYDTNLRYIELLFANNYICARTGSDLLLKKIARQENLNVTFDLTSLLFNPYRKVKRLKIHKRKIIYLPTAYHGSIRRLDGVQYPDVWYYALQKKIIDSFIHEKSFIFIWKGFSQMGVYAAVLDRYISNISSINVTFSFKILTEEIKDAYALITDYPSTGMYEAAFAGCPVFGVYPDWFSMNTYALEFWGKCLKPYSHEDEVVKYFKEFIYSDEIYTYRPNIV